MEYYDDMMTLSDANIKQLDQDMKTGKLSIDVIAFSRCKNHFFHKSCAERMVVGKGLKCALCNKIYGEITGNMPYGKMKWRVQGFDCNGYTNVGTIEILYEFPNTSINGNFVSGITRKAYLPNNVEGNEILKLLDIAFKRKLTFVIGTSITTGRSNEIVWNGIHHKTSTSGGAANYGYPDPTYFARVKDELELKGIVP